MNTWINNYHGTEALSSLSEEDILDIEISMKHPYLLTQREYNQLLKLRRLNKKLCPHNKKQCDCSIKVSGVEW